jgi:predicted MPP superfamily phosphohydrolase
MGFAWQRRLRTLVLGAVAVLTALLLVSGIGHLWMPRRAVIGMIVLMLVSPTVFWWAWVDERLAAVREHGTRRQRMVRVMLAACVGMVLIPVILFVVMPYYYDLLPVPVLMLVMSWHLSTGGAGAIGLLLWLGYLGARKLRRREAVNQGANPGTASMPVAGETRLSRRAFITGTLATAPMIVSAGMVVTGLRQEGQFLIRRVNLTVPRLPDRLRGLTITQLTDFHVGRFFRPEHLPRVVEAVNFIGSDLVVVTGDIVDHVAEFFPSACDAFREMESYGRFLVVGNHDLIDPSLDTYKYMREQFRTDFLADECRHLVIGGERVQVVGLGWSSSEQREGGLPGHQDRVKQAMAQADPNVFTIALAHHPHAFDALADAGADLTLSGHTHGGQVMLTSTSPAAVGCGSLLFRYISGQYTRGHAALYVSSGVGNWFPVRINAPAEIVQLRLV